MRTLLLALLALLAGCVTDPTPDAGTPGTGNDTVPDMDIDFDLQPEPIEVVVGEGGTGVPPTLYTISPKRLELKEDKAYNLTLRNAGRVPHDLVIEGLDVVIENVPPGQTSPGLVFIPQEKGTYVMYCTIGGDAPTSHKNQGMQGEVVVS